MRILAIDPGYDRIGIAVVEKIAGKPVWIFSECLETSRALPHEKRLAEIGREMKKVVKKYKPEILAVEKLFFTKNQKTAMKVAEARGMILHLGENLGLAVYEYTPLQVKTAVTGYGKSDKFQVTAMVKKLVKIPETKRRDDEYDAIAVALTSMASLRISDFSTPGN